MRGVAVRFPVLVAATVAGLSAPVAQAADKPKEAKSIWEQETLTGDWGGTRSALKDRGIDITLNYVGETFAVLSGGIDRRGSYEGRFEFSLDSDLEKLFGWKGAATHVTIYQIHNSGRNVEDNVGALGDPSNIDALPTTRLFTAWFEQNFNDRFALRVGQLAADDEFIGSPTASGLVNGTFGWAGILAADMLHGGPAYPLAAPGARLKITATPQLTLLAAVFTGDPAGANCIDLPQQCNRYGTKAWDFAGGSLWIGELQYAVNQDKKSPGMPGVYKLGAWYATTDFADQHFGLDGAGATVSLASPAAVSPLNHAGNWGVYAVADQMVWRGGDASLNLFARASLAPSDRNLISYYVDGGFGFKGLIPGRSDDTLTFGVAYAKISSGAAALDQDLLAANGPPQPIRDYEMVFELSYAAQIAPWWTVQPDLQYIVHPGGNVPDPNNANGTVANAFIAGVRSTIKF